MNWLKNTSIRLSLIILGLPMVMSGCGESGDCRTSPLVGTWTWDTIGTLRFYDTCEFTLVECNGKGRFTNASPDWNGTTVLTTNSFTPPSGKTCLSQGVHECTYTFDSATHGLLGCDQISTEPEDFSGAVRTWLTLNYIDAPFSRIEQSITRH